MPGEDSDDDTLREALMSEDTYDTAKAHTGIPFVGLRKIEHKLAAQSALLFVLFLHLPLYALIPVGDTVPTADPSQATPKIMMLAAFSLAMILIGAGAMLRATYRRLSDPPLTEKEAHDIVALEGFATAVSLGTGGLGTVLTTGFILIGVFGKADAYLSVTGKNLFASHPVAPSVTVVSITAFVAGTLLFVTSQYLRQKLAAYRRENDAVL